MKPLFPAALMLLTALAVASPAPTFASPVSSIFETRLPNGLRVIVQEDRRAPTAVHMVWYRAGSMDEKDGTSGVAHVLEHMMFKGTESLKSGEFNKRVAEVGGRDNAFTNRDYTAYFQIVPKAALAEMMKLEAERMRKLSFDAREFGAEIKVVMEERRTRTEDNPQGLLYEALNAAVFQAHPYRRPIIGWMNDLENLNWEDARDWYRRWYAPNNAYVVVVGDVDHRAVFRLAEKYYGNYKAQALPVRKPQAEPEQIGVRRLVVKAPAKLPYLMMAWKVPRLSDPGNDRESYALEVLASVLDGHDASRLSRNLVRGSRLAQSVGAGYDGTVRGEAMFLVDGQPAEGHSAGELEIALRAEIRRIADEGVAAEELERVKTQTIAAQVYKRDSLMAQAMEIGGMEAAGLHWRDLDVMLERLKLVTAGEVQAVAKKYFKDDGLTVAVLDPQPLDQARPRARGFATRH